MQNHTQATNRPDDSIVWEIVERLDENLRELFEERAGIIEFEAGLPRAHAECLALLGVLYRHPAVLTDVIAIEIQERGDRRWLVVSDLASIGRLTVVRTAQLVEVLREHLDEIVALSRADRS